MANRLASESSPYLLQHAENPVDWYPWGEEALRKAGEEEKPILLSIGYSACHWCHVMERESFEDDETARLMNEAFVSVKVDREERPDLDSVYMLAVQSMTGHGGWPLTVFLTPRGVPYYGGTYFPPEPRRGMPSFRQVLGAARDAWRDRREDVEKGAEELRDVLERATRGGAAGAEEEVEGGPRAPGPELLEHAHRFASSRYDPRHGGFGGAPKFPQPAALELLLHHHLRTGEEEPLRMVVTTLRGMARGGIRDHLAGGFHRYSVDERWLVPHFEKMLYDNALLARLYLRAWQVTGEDDLRTVAVSTLDYVLDDLRGPEGGFHSARDADSEGEEGRYYVWTPEEVDGVLEGEQARLFKRAYDVSPGGNWEGRSILHLPHDPGSLAASEGIEPAELQRILGDARSSLLDARARREPPLRDEKVLVGWNGLMLRALAEAAGALERADWLEAARETASFLLEACREGGAEDDRGGDRLLHVWKDGRARVPGFLEDYAALGNALLTLHEVTGEPRWRDEATWCAERIVESFWEAEEAVFYDTPREGEELVVRPRDAMDNPSPSGTSLAAELLLRLGHLLDRQEWPAITERVLAREAEGMRKYPLGYGRLLSVLDLHHAEPLELAVVGPRDDERFHALLGVVLRRWIPERTVTGWDPEAEPRPEIPLLEGRQARDGRPTAYLCRRYACREPVTEPEALERQLAER